MKTERKISIERRMIYGAIAFAIAVIILISVTVCYGYVVLTVNNYYDDSHDYARITAHAIQGDRAVGYLETGEKDAYYEEDQNFLNGFRDQVDLTRLYIFVPFEDHFVYLWEAAGPEGKHDLGDTEEYVKGEKEIVDHVLGKTSGVDYMFKDDPELGVIDAVYAPLANSEGECVAIVCVERPKPDYIRIVLQFIFAIVMSTAIVTLLTMVISYKVLQKILIKPLGVLTDSANRMVASLDREEPVKIDIKTHDELETLADAFTQMDVNLRQHIKDLSAITAEKERIDTELNLASQIQAAMLPRKFPPFPDRKDFDIYAVMYPAKEVGGDFYDFEMIDDDHLCMVIADVSGKGIPAALFMMASKITLSHCMKPGSSPAEILTEMNELIAKKNTESMFVTVWLGILELSTGKLTCANAGHEYPIFRRPGKKYQLIRDTHGFVVGEVPGVEYTDYEIQMQPGSQLFVYTDGLPEAANAEQEMFRTEKALAELNRNPDASPEETLKNVKTAVDDFVKDARQFDDLTMMCVTYNGPTE